MNVVKSGWFGVLVLMAALCWQGPAFGAERADLEARITALETELKSLKEELVRSKDVHVDEHGIEVVSFGGIGVGAGATGIWQATDNANGDNQARLYDDVNDASYSVDIEIDKSFEDYGYAYLHLEAGGGAGVEDELAVLSNVNRDADNDENVRVTEIYYEHYFEVLPLTLTVGKIDPTVYLDTNAYANDEAGQFLGRIFRNSPTVEFADNAAGVRMSLEPWEFLDAEFVAMDADSDFEDFFDNMFVAGQITWKPGFGGRDGNYRVFGWSNDRPHADWRRTERTKEEGYGFGVSIDQDITDAVGVFARYAWQDPDVVLEGESFSLEHSWSAGVQVSGSLWSRESDAIGVAFGAVDPSKDYVEVNTLRGDSEKHLEVYYNFCVNEHLTVGPDLQVIWDPYGNDAANGTKTITVYGLRGQMNY
ncbi:MAG: carbohydrate porin [Candidatus Omnitrophica bacterium]|nr:carbohydrate porin [Candidatus Omnitrophota bacterium]